MHNTWINTWFCPFHRIEKEEQIMNPKAESWSICLPSLLPPRLQWLLPFVISEALLEHMLSNLLWIAISVMNRSQPRRFSGWPDSEQVYSCTENTRREVVVAAETSLSIGINPQEFRGGENLPKRNSRKYTCWNLCIHLIQHWCRGGFGNWVVPEPY